MPPVWYPRPVVVYPYPLNAVPERVWYMPGERTSVYLAADLAAAVKAAGQPLAELGRRGEEEIRRQVNDDTSGSP